MKIKLLSMKVKVIHGLVPNYLSLSFPCRGTYHLPSHFCTHTLNPTQSSQLLLESNGLWAQVPFSAPMRSMSSSSGSRGPENGKAIGMDQNLTRNLQFEGRVDATI